VQIADITDAFLGVSWLICIDILNGTEMTFINCFVKFYLVCTSFIASNFQVLGIFIEKNRHSPCSDDSANCWYVFSFLYSDYI
jgi:hypothetical protein